VKTAIHVEFTDDELSDFGSRVLLKVVSGAWRSMEGAFADPQAAAIVMNLVQQAMQAGVRAGAQQRQRGPITVAFHPGAFGYGAPPGTNGPTGPGSVQNIRSGSAKGIEHCFPIEATRQTEEGWGCCQCATFNAVQRGTCRTCGHVLCNEVPPIVTPPPGPAAPPEGA
jgi:hypothetical protein